MDVDQLKEYRQVISQANFYMENYETKYGAVLTNEELVVFQRTEVKGKLLKHGPVQWGAYGARMTVLLGIWIAAVTSYMEKNNRPESDSGSDGSSPKSTSMVDDPRDADYVS